jgi:hypothetical protein
MIVSFRVVLLGEHVARGLVGIDIDIDIGISAVAATQSAHELPHHGANVHVGWATDGAQ